MKILRHYLTPSLFSLVATLLVCGFFPNQVAAESLPLQTFDGRLYALRKDLKNLYVSECYVPPGLREIPQECKIIRQRVVPLGQLYREFIQHDNSIYSRPLDSKKYFIYGPTRDYIFPVNPNAKLWAKICPDFDSMTGAELNSSQPRMMPEIQFFSKIDSAGRFTYENPEFFNSLSFEKLASEVKDKPLESDHIHRLYCQLNISYIIQRMLGQIPGPQTPIREETLLEADNASKRYWQGHRYADPRIDGLEWKNYLSSWDITPPMSRKIFSGNPLLELQGTEVSQGVFVSITGYNPSMNNNFKDCPESFKYMFGQKVCPYLPVDRTSWQDVQYFLSRLNQYQNASYEYILPTKEYLESVEKKCDSGSSTFFRKSKKWILSKIKSNKKLTGTEYRSSNEQDACPEIYHLNSNVSEWVSTVHSNNPKQHLIYGSNAANMYEDKKFYFNETTRYPYVGIRLVRKSKVDFRKGFLGTEKLMTVPEQMSLLQTGSIPTVKNEKVNQVQDLGSQVSSIINDIPPSQVIQNSSSNEMIVPVPKFSFHPLQKQLSCDFSSLDLENETKVAGKTSIYIQFGFLDDPENKIVSSIHDGIIYEFERRFLSSNCGMKKIMQSGSMNEVKYIKNLSNGRSLEFVLVPPADSGEYESSSSASQSLTQRLDKFLPSADYFIYFGHSRYGKGIDILPYDKFHAKHAKNIFSGGLNPILMNNKVHYLGILGCSPTEHISKHSLKHWVKSDINLMINPGGAVSFYQMIEMFFSSGSMRKNFLAPQQYLNLPSPEEVPQEDTLVQSDEDDGEKS